MKKSMIMLGSFIVLSFIVSFSISVAGTIDNFGVNFRDIINALKPANGEVTAMTARNLNGVNYFFIKFIDNNGNLSDVILNPQGQMISENDLPVVNHQIINERLQSVLDKIPNELALNNLIRVIIGFKEATDVDSYEIAETGTVDIIDGSPVVVINGTEISKIDIQEIQKTKQENIDAKRERIISNRRATIYSFTEKNGLIDDPSVRIALESGYNSIILSLTKNEILNLAKANDLIEGIEIYDEPQPELTSAMLATNINPYALNYTGRTGNTIGIYMSDGGCPDPGFITRYTRLSGATSAHSENTSAIARGVSPDSYIYCRSGFTLPTGTDLSGSDGNPRVYIQTHSWGSGNDTIYTISDRDFDDYVYNNAIATFKSAGNYGSGTGNVTTPGKALNVITVGNYDDTNNGINNTSSFVDPETNNQKPELVAPGTSITAGGWTMTGTSMASPHAAGFAADLMSDYTWLQLRPYFIKAKMMAGASDAITGGSDRVGVGGIDFYRTYYNGTNTWWEGNNSSFSYFDSIDPYPNNGYIDRVVYLTASSNVRIALAWLNRGTYVYNNKANVYPIGMDMDFTVYDPNGNYVASSSSVVNPYEIVSFSPSQTGNYVIKINRYANRDTNSNIRMGITIDWQ